MHFFCISFSSLTKRARSHAKKERRKVAYAERTEAVNKMRTAHDERKTQTRAIVALFAITLQLCAGHCRNVRGRIFMKRLMSTLSARDMTRAVFNVRRKAHVRHIQIAICKCARTRAQKRARVSSPQSHISIWFSGSARARRAEMGLEFRCVFDVRITCHKTRVQCDASPTASELTWIIVRICASLSHCHNYTFFSYRPVTKFVLNAHATLQHIGLITQYRVAVVEPVESVTTCAFVLHSHARCGDGSGGDSVQAHQSHLCLCRPRLLSTIRYQHNNNNNNTHKQQTTT